MPRDRDGRRERTYSISVLYFAWTRSLRALAPRAKTCRPAFTVREVRDAREYEGRSTEHVVFRRRELAGQCKRPRAAIATRGLFFQERAGRSVQRAAAINHPSGNCGAARCGWGDAACGAPSLR